MKVRSELDVDVRSIFVSVCFADEADFDGHRLNVGFWHCCVCRFYRAIRKLPLHSSKLTMPGNFLVLSSNFRQELHVPAL